jgi:hypothetical protein
MTKWIGNTLFSFDWAEDGKWDWTADNGDQHIDFVSIAVCRRVRRNFPVYRLILGPICLSMTTAKDE